MMQALHRPVLGPEELAALQAVLESGQLAQGPEVARFEGLLAQELGVEHVVAVSSGTAALHVAVLALGLTSHDEVIVPAFGFPATANAVELTGARALLADIDPERLALSVDSVLAAETERTVGVILVHPFGIPGPTEELRALCESRGWWLLEDAACALGTAQEGRWGSGDVPLCLSFHPRKTITTGEGGVVATNDKDLASALLALRNHGIEASAQGWRRFSRVGFNYRMSDLAAAMGCVQLGRLPTIVADRRRILDLYRRGSAGWSGLRWPGGYDLPELSAQSVVVELAQGVDRDQVITSLGAQGIQTTIAGYGLAEQPYYQERYDLSPADFPVSSRLAERGLTLPVTYTMGEPEVAQVLERLHVVLEES